ncbi:unnamed protein product, partial [Rotaria magnacalcarata]
VRQDLRADGVRLEIVGDGDGVSTTVDLLDKKP